MNIKRLIKEEFDGFLNEYISREEISLMKYLTLPVREKHIQIAFNYPEYIDVYLEEIENNEELEVLNGYDDKYDYIYDLKDKDNELFTNYGEWLYINLVGDNRSLIGIPPQDKPIWTYFSDETEIIKNQWLVHFTNDANSISKDGFIYGVDDLNKLGLTTYFDDFDKKYGGYNFAYTIDDYKKYSKVGSRYKYGEEVVLFRASGVRVWHFTDEEYQTIFYGNTAKDIIPITEGENNRWGIYSTKNGNLIVESDNLTQIIYWIINNYDQYRKHLV